MSASWRWTPYAAAIEVDLTGAEFGDAFHLSALKLPAGSSWAGQGDDTLATIVAPVGAEEEPAAEEPKA